MRTKKTDNYKTDAWLMDIFEDWFDPCPLNNGELREFDGLGSDWKDKTFVNPPYSHPKKWVEKAIKEYEKGNTIVLLLKHDSSTEWYRLLHEAGARFLLVNGRLKHGKGQSAPFPSMLAVLNKEGEVD